MNYAYMYSYSVLLVLLYLCCGGVFSIIVHLTAREGNFQKISSFTLGLMVFAWPAVLLVGLFCGICIKMGDGVLEIARFFEEKEGY